MDGSSHIDKLISSVYDVAQNQQSWQSWLTELCDRLDLQRAILELQAQDGSLSLLASWPHSDEQAAGVISRSFSLELPDNRFITLRFDRLGRLDSATFQKLAPHLSRAVQIVVANEKRAGELALSAQALAESLGVGVLLVNPDDLKIDYVSRVATELLSRFNSLCVVHGCLTSPDKLLQRKLKRAVSEVTTLKTSQPRHLSAEESGGRLSLVVQQEHWWATRPAENSEPKDQQQKPGVLILMTPSQAPWGMRQEQLGARYGLTPKEARVAFGLLCRMNLEELATADGVSIHTVRTQLKSAMRKVCVASQSALIRQLSGDPLTLFNEVDQ